MPWEVIALIVGAALGGRVTSALAGWAARRAGRSPETAEKAVATGGVSLLVEEKQHDHGRTPAGVV